MKFRNFSDVAVIYHYLCDP